MASHEVELALKKQRLLLKSAALRRRLAGDARGLMPLFAAADRARAGASWLRRNPQWLVAAGIALAVARPRAAFRWLRRAVIAWQGAKRLRALLAR